MRIHYKRLCFTQKPPRWIPITNLPTKTRKINPGSNGRLCRLESPQSDENMELVLPRINGCKVVIIRIYNESLLIIINDVFIRIPVFFTIVLFSEYHSDTQKHMNINVNYLFVSLKEKQTNN